MWSAIQDERKAVGKTRAFLPRLSPMAVRMFASVAAVLVVSLSLFYFFSDQSAPGKVAGTALLLEANREGLISTANNTARPMRVKLGDSSEVTLAPGAGLTYPRQFSAAKTRGPAHRRRVF